MDEILNTWSLVGEDELHRPSYAHHRDYVDEGELILTDLKQFPILRLVEENNAMEEEEAKEDSNISECFRQGSWDFDRSTSLKGVIIICRGLNNLWFIAQEHHLKQCSSSEQLLPNEQIAEGVTKPQQNVGKDQQAKSESDSEGEESEEEVMKLQDIEELVQCKKPKKPAEPDPKYCCGSGCYPWIFDTYDTMLEKYEKKMEEYTTKIQEFWTKFNVKYEEE